MAEEFKDGVWYTARAKQGAHLAESSRKGTLYLSVKFEITSGDTYGQEIEGQFYISDAAKERTAENLGVLGFDAYGGRDAWDNVSTTIGGKDCEVQAQVKLYKNNLQARVNGVRTKRTGAEKPLPDRAAEIFGSADDMREVAVATGGGDSDVPY